MSRRVVAGAVVGIAVAASVGTALALPAQPTTRSGVLVFTAEQTATRVFKGFFIGGDKDVSGGHIIGTDSLQCVVSSDGKTAKCDVAASFKRGQLYGVFTQNLNSGALTGTVTGGTRTFKGATGTITGSAVSDNQEKVHVAYQVP